MVNVKQFGKSFMHPIKGSGDETDRTNLINCTSSKYGYVKKRLSILLQKICNS